MDPTPAEMLSLVSGRDLAYLAPSRSKTDFTGAIYCPFPSVLPFDERIPTNAAAALRDIELDTPCHGALREQQPLFATESGAPYTHSVLDRWLFELLQALYDRPTAEIHSWHSLRVGLACALHSAGCSDDVIQLICRWASQSSLRTYRRLGTAENVVWTDRAERVTVDALQTTSFPIICGSEGFAQLQYESLRQQHPGAATWLRDDPTGLHNHARPPAPTVIPASPSPLAPSPPPADLRPLRPGQSVGRRVLVPARLWRVGTYTCDEHGGRGWTGRVLRERAGNALVHFEDAVTARGLPYDDTWLQLAVLEPL